MFKVEKKALSEALKGITKVVKDLTTIYLLTSTKEKTLWIIANEPTHYMKVAVVGAEVTKKGLVGLASDIFSSTLSMRGSEYEASYDEANSKLDINCGSRNSVYVLDVTKESIARDKDGSKYIDIPAKKVAFMREVFKYCTFQTPDASFTGSALFKNTKEGMSVRFASVNSCAFYDAKESISKTEFEVTVPMIRVMDVLSLVSSEAKISITDSCFIIESDTVEAVIPTMEDETKGYTDFYATLLGNKEFAKGYIDLVPKDVLPTLNSVRATSGGADVIKVSFNGNKGKMHLESKNGTSNDTFAVEKNTLGKISMEIPEVYLHSTLSTASTSAERVRFYAGAGGNLYKLVAENDLYSFMAVGPVSS